MKVIKDFKRKRKLNKYLKERKQFDMIIPNEKFLEMTESDVILLCEWVQANNYVNSTRTVIKMSYNTLYKAKGLFHVSEIMGTELEIVLGGYKIDTNRAKQGFVVITTI